MNKFNHLYDRSYFESRNMNDKKRLKSFEQEKIFIEKTVSLNGVVCDVGCSTGEFLVTIEWRGAKFGMEINEEAIELARKNGINFEENILTKSNFFDAVIFRGTIQHLPDPFGYISKAYDSLKVGGHIIFLATPNANSVVYKLFGTLPALNPKLNFYIPSDISLIQILKNYGFELMDFDKPYINSPYANPVMDHLNFLTGLIIRRKPSFPFWGSMMNISAIKK